MDSGEDPELNELARIACALLDSPVGFISFMDDKKQWFKAKVNLDLNEVPLDGTVCKHLLDKPTEVLLVENFSEKEEKIYGVNLVKDFGMYFYAGAPIVSEEGNVLGNICVLDYKSKQVSKDKIEALKLLAGRVMRCLEQRRLALQQERQIEYNAYRMKRLADLAPGVIFKLSAKATSPPEMIFINEGITRLVPQIKPELIKRDPKILLKFVAEPYDSLVKNTFRNSFYSLSPIDIEVKIEVVPGQTRWLWLSANPEQKGKEQVVWYGTMQDISHKKGHLAALEKMLFDISHVIRRPLANILGLIDAIKSQDTSENSKAEMLKYIQDSINELEQYVHKLNQEYSTLKDLIEK